MKYTKIFLIGVVFLFVSCAERYSTRKRTESRQTGKEKGIISSGGRETTVSTNEVKSGSNKTTTSADKKTYTSEKEYNESQNKSSRPQIVQSNQKLVIDTALSYLGTPYRYGGTTRKGMDCSGLVGISFDQANISLHRSSLDMSKQGEEVPLSQVQVGDLLFFSTGKKERISHVGIVVEAIDDVKFIHSSTSRGVIISSIKEGYWNKAYRKAKRVLM